MDYFIAWFLFGIFNIFIVKNTICKNENVGGEEFIGFIIAGPLATFVILIAFLIYSFEKHQDMFIIKNNKKEK